jgi:hypothetical protein
MEAEAEWTWRDDRFWPRIQRGRGSWATTRLQEDFYGGWSLYEPTLRDSMASIAQEPFALRKLYAERDRRLQVGRSEQNRT